MSIWIQNLKGRLENHPVVILHGNVRDHYIDEHGHVYDNLTTLLEEIAHSMLPSFPELVFYDPIDHERRRSSTTNPKVTKPPKKKGGTDEFADTAPPETLDKKPDPTQVLAQWQKRLREKNTYHFVVLFYLDKLVAYKTSYQKQEEEILLRLEKIIENITSNHRLILVALQDTLIPPELYTHSPNTALLPIPLPSKVERENYLKHRLGDGYPHLEFIANLTDGLFLRDLENIYRILANQSDLSAEEVRRKVNKYRIGEQEDYWGKLSIQKLDSAKKWFEEDEGVKGQTEALGKVLDMLELARAGLSGLASGTSSKPKGVLFFAGPTGVGKTFMAKKLAKFLFGTEEAFLRFDMSEFKEEHTVSKLIGSPPGYVGYERGGLLTNTVRDRPFSVILFDEIEKAHPKIMDIFLQLLDEGRLTDSRGQTIFFTETVIIFTSNLGARTNDSRGMLVYEYKELTDIRKNEELNDEERKSGVRKHFISSVERFFMTEISRPELLNRIGNNIVPFNFIHTPQVQAEIVKSHLQRIEYEFADRHRSDDYKLVFDQIPIADWLVQEHGDHMSMFGGRGITNAIETETMKQLARAVLRAEHDKRKGVTFHLGLNPKQQIEVEESR